MGTAPMAGIVGFVDSTVVVDLLRNYSPAMQWFSGQRSLAITPIVYLELVAGARNKSDQQLALNMLKVFQIEYLTRMDMDWAIQQMTRFHLSYNVGPNDCLIASVCHRLQVPLYTHNRKHFLPMLGTSLTINPY
jgi:predicted nucleic acid-binding protein